jgi:peptidyl-prolyl cis-trans isomerase SurA
MMRKLLTCITLSWVLTAFTWVGDAVAQDAQRIAAVVNDQVISVRDLENRLSLLIATSNLEDRPEVRRRLAPEVLRVLIDDVLKLQEAKRLNVVVSKDDVERALQQIERQSNLPQGRLRDALANAGVSLSTLIDQVEVEIAWVKAVTRLERGRTEIGDDEIDEELARIQRNAGNPEFLVAEIFLPVDDPAKEAEVRQLAERLAEQTRGGASFPALARNFSQGASAAVGGDLGWVQLGQLGAEIDAALQRLEPGQVSDPIRTTSGFHLLALRERRVDQGLAGSSVRVSLHQVFLPVSPDASPAEVSARMEEAQKLSEPAQNCADLEALNREGAPQVSGSLGEVEIGTLPEEIRNVVLPLEAGQKSAPFRSGGGVVVLMVCDRQGEDDPLRQREMIRRALENERLSAAAQRYLRDLRRAAFVDIRI